MNGDEINEDTCKLAVSGGNFEIIHLCEQKGLQFENCLSISSMFHRFEIFEWLNTHFEYEEIPLAKFIKFYNEPLFYSYSLSGSNIETKNERGSTPINRASFNGSIEVVKYLYETCHAKVDDKAINNASSNGHFEIKEYLSRCLKK